MRGAHGARRRGASVIGAAARWPTARLGEAPLALGAAALEVAPRGFRGRELLRAFWLRFDRFDWDFVWDISRGHFWELE